MRTSRVTLIAMAIVALMAGRAAPASKPTQAETVIKAAARQGRHVFVTFYKKNDAASTRMLADAKKIQGKLSRRASFTTVDFGSSANKALIQRYGVDRSPIPLTIVLAPNGAVTAGFVKPVAKTDLSRVFVSKGKAEVLKTLQYQKMAVICVQNARTKHNKESLAAAEGLTTDPQFSGASKIIRIDPKNPAESKFLREFKVNTSSREAQMIIVAPPGTVVAKFSGAVSTNTVMAKVTGYDGSGCGPSGACGPAG